MHMALEPLPSCTSSHSTVTNWSWITIARVELAPLLTTTPVFDRPKWRFEPSAVSVIVCVASVVEPLISRIGLTAGAGERRALVGDSDLAAVPGHEVAVRNREVGAGAPAGRDAVLPGLQRRELAGHHVRLVAHAGRAGERRSEPQLGFAVHRQHLVVGAVDRDAVAAAAVGALPARAGAAHHGGAVGGGAGAAAGRVGRRVADRPQVAGAGAARAGVRRRAGGGTDPRVGPRLVRHRGVEASPPTNGAFWLL